MAKRTVHKFGVSPLNPSIHFVLFLLIAFLLVVFIAFVMKQTAASTRAIFACPLGDQANNVSLVQQLSRQCSAGVEYTKDANGCGIWVCKLSKLGAPGANPLQGKIPTPSVKSVLGPSY
jgi:hypothetical protein